ncbi:transcriptional regulator [Niabella ginsenosidivorans]|uniref:Transcriptional regulator n=2 Tax=Niabella ginsenosidivorans TaxID=1176587 RepID=A0A1A9I9D1_9BACT|nr:transcriptional regulator [Niabella ginsenosidivorans]
MYIPAFNKMTDKEEILSFIKRFSFGMVVTMNAAGRPAATHLPFLAEEKDNGLTLLSHFAKANPQWKTIGQNENILVIFSEPHAYISPSNYEKELNVPTWNYIAVHLYGRGELITGQQQVTDLLNQTIETYEPAQKAKHAALPENFKTKMMNGIVAFKVDVTDIQAKKKLSQNKTRKEQEQIIHTLAGSRNTMEQLVAAYMQQELKD